MPPLPSDSMRVLRPRPRARGSRWRTRGRGPGVPRRAPVRLLPSIVLDAPSESALWRAVSCACTSPSGSTIRNAKRKLCRFRRSWWSANRAARLLPTEASSRRHQLAAALLQELLDLVAPLFRERIAEHEQDRHDAQRQRQADFHQSQAKQRFGRLPPQELPNVATARPPLAATAPNRRRR